MELGIGLEHQLFIVNLINQDYYLRIESLACFTNKFFVLDHVEFVLIEIPLTLSIGKENAVIMKIEYHLKVMLTICHLLKLLFPNWWFHVTQNIIISHVLLIPDLQFVYFLINLLELFMIELNNFNLLLLVKLKVIWK